MQQEELKRFLDSGFTLQESTDVIVSAQRTEYRVQKSVISAHSKVFARACSQDLNPGAVLQLNLVHADPASIKALLAFCYQPEDFRPQGYVRSSINEVFGRSLEDEEAIIAYTVMYFLAKMLKMARLVRHSLDEIFSEFWSYFGDPPDDPDSFPKALFNILFAYASKGPPHLIRDPDYKWLLGEIEGLRDSIVEFGANHKDQLRTCKEGKEGSSISFQDQDYTLYLRDECWRCPKCRAVNKLEEPARDVEISGERKRLEVSKRRSPRVQSREDEKIGLKEVLSNTDDDDVQNGNTSNSLV
ncbi:hypothetical protein BKA80DRAFT_346181 [Phyllosticta citrichinensis]